MMRGRKPTPTALKILAGNPGKHRLNDDEPKPELASGRCPRWVPKGRPREVWSRLARDLVPTRVLTRADETALGNLAIEEAAYLDAVEALEAITSRRSIAGLVAALEQDPRLARDLIQAAYALASTRTAHFRALTAALAEFGMTPSSRSRIKAAILAPENPVLDFLARRPGVA
jgi:P27 family predicted phage terminase small subunit